MNCNNNPTLQKFKAFVMANSTRIPEHRVEKIMALFEKEDYIHTLAEKISTPADYEAALFMMEYVATDTAGELGEILEQRLNQNPDFLKETLPLITKNVDTWKPLKRISAALAFVNNDVTLNGLRDLVTNTPQNYWPWPTYRDCIHDLHLAGRLTANEQGELCAAYLTYAAQEHKKGIPKVILQDCLDLSEGVRGRIAMKCFLEEPPFTEGYTVHNGGFQRGQSYAVIGNLSDSAKQDLISNYLPNRPILASNCWDFPYALRPTDPTNPNTTSFQTYQMAARMLEQNLAAHSALAPHQQDFHVAHLEWVAVIDGCKEMVEPLRERLKQVKSGKWDAEQQSWLIAAYKIYDGLIIGLDDGEIAEIFAGW